MQKTVVEKIREFYSAAARRGVNATGSYMYWSPASMKELKEYAHKLGWRERIEGNRFNYLGVWHLPVNDLFNEM